MTKFQKAKACFDEACAHHRRGEHTQALQCYQRANALLPRNEDILTNMALLLLQMGQYRQSAALCTQALSINGRNEDARAHLVFCETMAALTECDWSDRERLAARALEDVEAGTLRFEPYVLTSLCDSAALQQQRARQQVAAYYPPQPPLYDGQPYRHDKVRIAYLSSDLREHAVAYLMAELFERHDRSRFEVTAVSFGLFTPGPFRERLVSAFDRFLDVTRQSDEAVARTLRDMEIDIAIDLNGYTEGCRPNIFAQRPAPVQVSYIGYPGTMGAPYFDYILADPVVIPPGHEGYYDEQVVYMPHSYQVNDRSRQPAEPLPSRHEAGLPGEGFVFCCFNNNFKLNPAMFDVWMRLLQQVPGSVLWLVADSLTIERNLRREARKRGVAPERLIFAPRVDRASYLARLQLADLFLDTQPYGAHGTASDVLWMGVPLLTCLGGAFPGRVAASLLTALDMPELIAPDLAAYEARALQWALHPEMLADVRQKLLAHRDSKPLFDGDLFRRHLEAAFIEMRRRSRAGEPAAPMRVSALPV